MQYLRTEVLFASPHHEAHAYAYIYLFKISRKAVLKLNFFEGKKTLKFWTEFLALFYVKINVLSTPGKV